jgi:hypothetical protein
MQYSRNSPSERYRLLVDLYGRMHAEGEPGAGRKPMQTFAGQSLLPQVGRIKNLIERAGAATLLDYGCGKALSYELRNLEVEGHGVVASIVDYWDVAGVCFYDPGFEPFRALPAGKFDGVIATDVLEHCPQDDLPWILDEIFGYANRFVFANVASYPARKLLANGENAHCTIQPPAWWEAVLRETAARHADVMWEVWVRFRADDGTVSDHRLGNIDAGS